MAENLVSQSFTDGIRVSNNPLDVLMYLWYLYSVFVFVIICYWFGICIWYLYLVLVFVFVMICIWYLHMTRDNLQEDEGAVGWRSTSACGARSLRPPWSRARIADWGTSTYFEVLWVTSGYLEALWANKSYFQVLWGTSACRVRRFCSPWYWARIADNRAQIYVIYIFIWYIQMWYIWYLCAVLVPGVLIWNKKRGFKHCLRGRRGLPVVKNKTFLFFSFPK